MNIVQRASFGEIEAIQLGFGPVGRPLMSVYMYWVDGHLIDTGQRNMRSAVMRLLSEKKVEGVLLTHHHEDHSGNAATIRRLYGVGVTGHPETGRLMKNGFSIRPYQFYVWGRADRTEMVPFSRYYDTERFRLTPIHTPGHSHDHTVYLEEGAGWLFSGDLYLGDKIKYFRTDEQLAEQIDSLKKVLRFDFESIFCAHRPCLHNGKIHLKNKLSFLEDFFGNILAMKQKGYSERAIIRKFSSGQDRMVKWVSLGNVSFANMVRSALRSALARPINLL